MNKVAIHSAAASPMLYRVVHALLASGVPIEAGAAVIAPPADAAGLVRAGYLAPLDTLPPEGAIVLGRLDEMRRLDAEAAGELLYAQAEAVVPPGGNLGELLGSVSAPQADAGAGSPDTTNTSPSGSGSDSGALAPESATDAATDNRSAEAAPGAAAGGDSPAAVVPAKASATTTPRAGKARTTGSNQK